MKNITRLEAQRRLAAAGIESKIVFGTSLSAKCDACSLTVFCTDTRGRNVRIDQISIHPYAKQFGGSAAKAVALAKRIGALLNCPARWETGSIQHTIQTIHTNGTTSMQSCVSPYSPKTLPLP